MNRPALYYKLARPDGWDFYTGTTINYREAIGGIVKHPHPAPEKGICSSGVLHASLKVHDCFQGATIPCSIFRVRGIPVLDADPTKHGFTEFGVLAELNPNRVFKWRYWEACNPVHPFQLSPSLIDDTTLQLLGVWASVRDSVWDSVWTNVRDSVWANAWDSVGTNVWDSVGTNVRASVRASVWASVWASVRASVWASVWDSVRDSVWASVWAYMGYLFVPAIKDWQESYPFQSAVDLWKQGLVPSFDGKLWNLHAGSNGEIVWNGNP